MRSRISFSLTVILLLFPCLAAAQSGNRVTILYDAFGKSPAMTKAWGFSVLVEYGGKRILFDTGGDAEIFEHNVKALGVDLTKLDFVVLSHRHSDHIRGVNYLLRVNPAVKIYTPADPWGPFGWSVPNSLYRKDESLAANRSMEAGLHCGWPLHRRADVCRAAKSLRGSVPLRRARNGHQYTLTKLTTLFS